MRSSISADVEHLPRYKTRISWLSCCVATFFAQLFGCLLTSVQLANLTLNLPCELPVLIQIYYFLKGIFFIHFVKKSKLLIKVYNVIYYYYYYYILFINFYCFIGGMGVVVYTLKRNLSNVLKRMPMPT